MATFSEMVTSGQNPTPFGNLLYIKVNSIGKQWIGQYALDLCQEQLR